MGKRVLVTGGGGFVGGNLCEKLLESGHEVICLDNFYSGSKKNLIHCFDYTYFEVMRHDVTFPFYVEVDQIYNLASPASPIWYQKDPVMTTKTNVHGAINVLGLAKRLGVPILQASTSEVYGDPHVHPQVENYWGNVNPIGVRACYDEGKRCAETLFFDYWRQHNVQVKVVRIFNTYGPKMSRDDGRVVSNMIVQAIEGRPVTVYGDGSQTRSFMYVDDLIRACIDYMELDYDFPGPINLGNPSEISIKKLAGLINLACNRDADFVEYKELPSDDPSRRKPDISVAREVLGWSPSVELSVGLEKTVAFFNSSV